MKITDVTLYILEHPEQKQRQLQIVPIPDVHPVRYTHISKPDNRPARQAFIEVSTDEGTSGRCDTNSITPEQIENTDYYEYFQLQHDGHRRAGETWGLLNAPLIEDGHISPPDGPGWGAEWDEAQFRARVVAEY